MPIYPLLTDRRHGSAGFTLVELLVVISVAGLLMVLAAPAMTRPGALDAARTVARITAHIASARTDAALSGQPVSIDVGKDLARTDLAFVPQLGQASQLVIYPDGSTNGGTISVDGAPLATIRWLDSEVRRATR